MSIVPCFDPTTGASGGASSGGGSATLSNLTFETVDLTTGWTLLDPDSLVKAVSFAGGFNTITLNELATGSNLYNWASGTSIQAPRWYKLLTVSGSQVTEATRTAIHARYENDDTVNTFSQRVVFGSASDPTSTTALTIAGAGGSFARSISGSTSKLRAAYGVWTQNSEAINTSNLQAYSVVSQYRGDSGLGTPIVFSLNSSNAIVHVNSRNSNRNNLGSAAVYLIVGVGIRDNTDTIDEDDTVKFKLGFRAVTLEAG